MDTTLTASGNQVENTGQLESIQWKQLWSLAALYGSIIIGWIAYENYQPKLLVQFHFTEFTFLLLAVQAVILTVTPIIAGRMGDKFRFSQGNRLPVISSGISFAAMIFMAVAFTLLSNPGEFMRWLLPLLIVCWLIAMSIFTSPALSTLELFTPVEKLPHAMALLTIVSNLIYSLEPVIVDIIDYLGAPITFMAGGVVVFISGYALRRHSLALFEHGGQDPRKTAIKLDTQKSAYRYIFFLGLMLGLATAVLFNFFPDILYQVFGNSIFGLGGAWMILLVLLLSAILSLPVSRLIDHWGLEKSFWLSIALTLVSAVAIFTMSAYWVVMFFAILFSFAFTLLSVSSLPLAIKRANYYEKVFCVGIFFSGAALPDGFIQAWLAY